MFDRTSDDSSIQKLVSDFRFIKQLRLVDTSQSDALTVGIDSVYEKVATLLNKKKIASFVGEDI